MRGSLKTTSGTCLDIVTYIGCLDKLRWSSSEPSNTNLLRNRSVIIPKQQLRNALGSISDWFLSWCIFHCSSGQHFSWLRLEGDLSHGDWSTRRDSLLLPWDFIRKTDEAAVHKSATILHWKHPYDNWIRPNPVSPKATGDQQHFCQIR